MKKRKSHKLLWIILGTIITLIVIIVIAFTFYINTYYKSSSKAKEALKSSVEINISKEKDYYLFEPKKYDTGIIFYPGGKVEAEAYAPLLRGLAEKDILCVLYKMPFNLAIFDKNKANSVIDKYDVDWYMSGHSLGGVIASSYTADNLDKVKGIILLASYTTVDLSNTNLEVLSIYGTNDNILNMKKYQENLKNLPSSYKEYIINGGNHSGFADYGLQKNDGIPSISTEEQISKCIQFIIDSFSNTNKIYYNESNTYIKNPDCGFYSPIYIKCSLDGVSDINNNYLNYNQLLHLRIDISAFSKMVNGIKDYEFTDKMLSGLDDLFEKIDDASASVIIRFAYDPSFDGNKNMEPQISMIKKHICSLRDLFFKYEKMITAVECGLIGPWGEMHSSDIAEQETYNILIDEYLKVLPQSLKLLLRKPKFIYSYYGYSLENLETFNIKDIRLGVYNDGYLGSESDLGTYDDRKKEVNWLENINENCPYGGEVTVPDSEYNRLSNAVDEMFKLKLSYLNISWNDNVVDRWKKTKYTGQDALYKDLTEFDYINNHLGYRFVLETITYKIINNNISFNINYKNVGYGNLLKSKNAYIILKNNDNMYKFEFNEYNNNFNIDISEVKKGEYDIYFVLADYYKDYGIRSIAFGNDNIWNDEIKANLIISNFSIN